MPKAAQHRHSADALRRTRLRQLRAFSRLAAADTHVGRATGYNSVRERMSLYRVAGAIEEFDPHAKDEVWMP